MKYIELILTNSSLWEMIAFIVVAYILIFDRKLLRSITRIKVGDLEVELKTLKKEVASGRAELEELESELETERRLFDDIIETFDPNSPVKDLAEARAAIKSKAKGIEEIRVLQGLLTLESTPSELYAAAVSIRERRPTQLTEVLVEFIDQIAKTNDLGNIRLNTIWTLTSALHLTLLSAIRDGVKPAIQIIVLRKASIALDKLEIHPLVQGDRPDKPMKGVRGPIKHCRSWIEKGLAEQK